MILTSENCQILPTFVKYHPLLHAYRHARTRSLLKSAGMDSSLRVKNPTTIRTPPSIQTQSHQTQDPDLANVSLLKCNLQILRAPIYAPHTPLEVHRTREIQQLAATSPNFDILNSYDFFQPFESSVVGIRLTCLT